MRRNLLSILAGTISGLFAGFVYRLFKVLGSGSIDLIHSFASGSSSSGFTMSAVTDGMLKDRIFWIVFAVAFLIIGGTVFIKFTLYGKADEKRNFYYSRKGTQGTSTEMTDAEFNRELKNVKTVSGTKDFIFGEKGKSIVTVNDKNIRPDDNRNVMVVGSMGSKKSQAIIRVNILQCVAMGYSMMITDPSGDIYRDLSKTLELSGYTVKVWNTINPNASDSFDALGAAYESNSIDVFCNTFISNTQSGKVGETFFESAILSLMQAMCYLVTTREYQDRYLNGKRGTLEDARNALSRYSEAELDDIFLKTLQSGSDAQEHWIGFSKSTNRGNTISDLLNRMSLWINPVIKSMTSEPDIDLQRPGREKCAYFVITSDQDDTRAALSALFFQMLTISLVREADANENNMLARPVHLFLDEFVHLGNMGNFTDQLGTWRKRGISCTIVTQSYADLAKIYEEWESIVNGCRYNVYMGCSDMMTLEYYEKLAGISTVRTKNHRTDAMQAVDLGMRMKGETERPTVRADEFRTLDPDYLYLTVYGCHVLKLKKHYFYEDPRGKKINASPDLKQKADDHIPKWRINGSAYISSNNRPTRPQPEEPKPPQESADERKKRENDERQNRQQRQQAEDIMGLKNQKRDDGKALTENAGPDIQKKNKKKGSEKVEGQMNLLDLLNSDK